MKTQILIHLRMALAVSLAIAAVSAFAAPTVIMLAWCIVPLGLSLAIALALTKQRRIVSGFGARIHELGGQYVDRTLGAPPRVLTALYEFLFSPGPQIVHVDMAQAPVSDHDLKFLRRLTSIRSLDLSKTAISDELFRSLPVMPSLCVLRLNDVAISDAACQWIERCRALRLVDLANTSITDEGAHLLMNALPLLKSMELRGTLVAPEMIQRLASRKASAFDPNVRPDSSVSCS